MRAAPNKPLLLSARSSSGNWGWVSNSARQQKRVPLGRVLEFDMRLRLRSGLVCLSMLAWGRSARSQDTLPFTGKVNLILTPTGPSSPPGYIDSMQLEIVARDGF